LAGRLDQTIYRFNATAADPDVNVIYEVAFSPDGKYLGAAGSDKTVRLYDAATGKQLAVGAEHKDVLHSVQFSPDGKRLLTVGRDSVKVWTVAELLKRKGE
jgi:WD40 repeat protein